MGNPETPQNPPCPTCGGMTDRFETKKGEVVYLCHDCDEEAREELDLE